VPLQHTHHAIILHPLHALLGIHLLLPAPTRNKPITLQPPTRHENKHSERRVAEPKPLRQRLAQAADEQIDLLDAVRAVHVLELFGERRVAAGQLQICLGSGHVEESSEGIVARDGAFAVAQDVDGAHVAGVAVRGGELAHEGGHVVVGDGAGVVDAEGEEGVAEGDVVVEWVAGFVEGNGGNGEGGGVGAGLCGEEGHVVWGLLAGCHMEEASGCKEWQMDCLTGNETVESVDCDELFGQGIRDVVVVNS
jgi:hypothetical protein